MSKLCRSVIVIFLVFIALSRCKKASFFGSASKSQAVAQTSEEKNASELIKKELGYVETPESYALKFTSSSEKEPALTIKDLLTMTPDSFMSFLADNRKARLPVEEIKKIPPKFWKDKAIDVDYHLVGSILDEWKKMKASESKTSLSLSLPKREAAMISEGLNPRNIVRIAPTMDILLRRLLGLAPRSVLDGQIVKEFVSTVTHCFVEVSPTYTLFAAIALNWNEQGYMDANQDIKTAFQNNTATDLDCGFHHYVTYFGQELLRNPHTNFDTIAYLMAYPEVLVSLRRGATFKSAWGHYLLIGKDAGFEPMPKSAAKIFQPPPPDVQPGVEKLTVYRKIFSLDHLFTLDLNEAGGTYQLEGPAFQVFRTQVAESKALFRCYSSQYGQHAALDDFTCGWPFLPEGVLGYVYASPGPGRAPIYNCRSSNHLPNTIMFKRLATLTQSECVSAGFIVEGIMGYAPQ